MLSASLSPQEQNHRDHDRKRGRDEEGGKEEEERVIEEVSADKKIKLDQESTVPEVVVESNGKED